MEEEVSDKETITELKIPPAVGKRRFATASTAEILATTGGKSPASIIPPINNLDDVDAHMKHLKLLLNRKATFASVTKFENYWYAY